MRRHITARSDAVHAMDVVAYFERPLQMRDWLPSLEEALQESGHVDPRYARRKACVEARAIRRYRNWHRPHPA